MNVRVLRARVSPSGEDTMRSLRVMVLLIFCCIIGKSIILLFIADRSAGRACPYRGGDQRRRPSVATLRGVLLVAENDAAERLLLHPLLRD